MAATALVPVKEYLDTAYQPDCDYLEGMLLERNVGELSHSDAQSACLFYVRTFFKDYWAGVKVRVQVQHERFRVPDVAIVRGGRPSGRILKTAPLVAIEVLSPSDRMHEMQERIDDYVAFGVSAVWVLDPESKRGFVYTSEGSREAKDGVLWTPADAELTVPLASVFVTELPQEAESIRNSLARRIRA
jgi:Uma2 family endonuclease